MRMLGKRFLSLLLALGMLLMRLPAAAASELTMLQVDFLGMYATSAGTYESRKFTGDFTVMQNGEAVGTIRLTDFGSDPISVPGTGNVQLVPVAETMPEDAVMAASYTVSIVDGRLNKAVIAVLTDTGLFTVHTESSSSFDLINERGETILSFDTDSRGDYALPAAIHTGLYTLRMTKASLAIESWRDKIINIERYTGADSVTKVNASYYYVPPTMAPTATPADNADTYTDGNAYANGNGNTYADPDGDPDLSADGSADRKSDRESDGGTHGRADANPDGDPHPEPDAHAEPDAYAYADPHP